MLLLGIIGISRGETTAIPEELLLDKLWKRMDLEMNVDESIIL
jgi:hypothetical protein